MSEFYLGENSRKRLDTCHPDIQLVVEEGLKASQVDFGVACGHRPVSEQQALYAQGRTEPGQIVTYVDGVNKKSDHNYNPSRAVDLYAWVNGKALWSERYLTYIAGVLTATAARLYAEGRISHRWKWGANWDRDGQIVSDHGFVDYPHHAIVG